MRALPIIFAAALFAAPALAQDSVTHSAAASEGLSEVTGHLAASGVQVAAGVSVLPLASAGAGSMAAGTSALIGGVVAGATGAAIAEAAGETLNEVWGPLKVDDRVVVAPDPAPRAPAHPAAPRR